MPYGLINFVQGAGRAGRSPEVQATVLVIHNPRRSQSSLPTDRTLIRPGNHFVTTTDCRRKVVSVNFNFQEDHDRDCIDFQVVLNDSEFPPCDNCDSQEPTFPSLMQQLIRAARKDPKTSTIGLSNSIASTSTASNSTNLVTAPAKSTRPPRGYLVPVIAEYLNTPVASSSRPPANPSTPMPSSPVLTSFVPPSSTFATPIAHRTMAVTPLQLANAQQGLGDVRKQQVIDVVNTILQRFRQKCLVCYLHGRGFIDVEEDLPHHTDIWTNCLRNCGSLKMNKLFQFKREVNGIFKTNGEKYRICYHCLVPQGRFMPEEHRAWVEGASNK